MMSSQVGNGPAWSRAAASRRGVALGRGAHRRRISAFLRNGVVARKSRGGRGPRRRRACDLRAPGTLPPRFATSAFKDAVDPRSRFVCADARHRAFERPESTHSNARGTSNAPGEGTDSCDPPNYRPMGQLVPSTGP